MSDNPKSSRMKETLGLLQPQPATVKKAEGQHPIECPCCECEARRGVRDVEAFASIREPLKEPTPQAFYPGDQRPSPLPRRPWHVYEQSVSAEALAKDAAIMAMAAQALPKQKGRKKEHSESDLFRLLQDVEKIHADSPGMSDKQALARYSEDQGLSVSTKTLQNLLGDARKRFKEPEPTISIERFIKALSDTRKPKKKRDRP